MDFDDKADLDTSQVEDLRAGGGGGGFTLPGVKVGGGIVGLILTIVIGLLAGTGNMPGLGGGSGASDNADIDARCKTHTNAERFQDADCRQIATFNDLQKFWTTAAPEKLGAQYRTPKFVIFRDGVNTACGQATAAVGPFYCPGDEKIYIDLGFYDELASKFGAPGEFAQAYVIAHEFGHHIQTLTGTEKQVRRLQQRDPGRANQYSVSMELQADCYAGAWAKGAASPDGLVGTISAKDISEALGAAASVGDDRIQEQSGRGANPESWTHGSAEQRQKWFNTGFSNGDPKVCNTFGS